MSVKEVRVLLAKEGPDRSYSVYVGRNLSREIKNCLIQLTPSKCIVVAEQGFENFQWYKNIFSAIQDANTSNICEILIKGGESAKDLSQISDLWSKFQRAGLDRKSLVINIGGGALCDASGFAASTYMRGVSFVNIPTTLLSQVDASIGGKVAIDHSGVKNLVGTISQPKSVIIDLESLQTLPEREYYSGFAEIIKHGLITDIKYFEAFEKATLKDRVSNELVNIVHDSCNIKALIVSEDENEQGLRKVLNFGHTIGHAIESLSIEKNRALLHGESISLGFVAEGFISYKLGYITKAELERIEKACHKALLPTRLSEMSSDEELLKKIVTDKKNVAGEIRWVLLSSLGKAVFDQKVEPEIVTQSLEYLRNG